MNGIVKEGEDLMSDCEDTPALNSVIIAGSQKVEHYEIAAYGTLRSYAAQLSLHGAVPLLQETLDEEKEADNKLTLVAEALSNPEAEHAESDGREQARFI